MASIESYAPRHPASATTRAKHLGWTVRSHASIERLAENLWWTWGSAPGTSLRRSTVLARRRDGDLVVHGCVALTASAARDLETIGEPRYLVVPGVGHCLDARAYAARYPRIQLFAPRGARDAIARRVRVDGIFEDFPADGDVQLEMLHGVGDAEGALFVSSRDGVTVVLDDVISNIGRKREPISFVLETLLRSEPVPRIRRLASLFFVKDASALRRDLRRFAEHPELTRLVVGHEKIVSRAAAARTLERAAASL